MNKEQRTEGRKNTQWFGTEMVVGDRRDDLERDAAILLRESLRDSGSVCVYGLIPSRRGTAFRDSSNGSGLYQMVR